MWWIILMQRRYLRKIYLIHFAFGGSEWCSEYTLQFAQNNWTDFKIPWYVKAMWIFQCQQIVRHVSGVGVVTELF